MIAQNDTILTDYIWQLYQLKNGDSIIVITPKIVVPPDNSTCSKIRLRQIRKVSDSGYTIRLYPNDFYIDGFLAFPTRLNVYEFIGN